VVSPCLVYQNFIDFSNLRFSHGHFPQNTKCSALLPLNSDHFLFVCNSNDEEGQLCTIYLMHLCTKTMSCSFLDINGLKGHYKFMIRDPTSPLRFVFGMQHDTNFFYRIIQVMNAKMEFGPRVEEDTRTESCLYALDGKLMDPVAS
jgi:hypothetical protein